MKFTRLLLLISFFSAQTSAAIYKCTDPDGNKVYRPTPCEEGYNNTEINLKTGSSINLDEEKKQELLKQKEEEVKLEQQKLAQKQADIRKQEALNESTKNQLYIKNHPTQFSAFAIPPYQSDNLSPLVQQYETRLADIERLRRLAAEKALASEQCIRVESVELNEKSTKELLVFLVDCSSAKSFYYNEQELAK